MARRSGTVVALRPEATTLEHAVRRFLSERDLSPGTRRVYSLTFDRLTSDLGATMALSAVTTAKLHNLLARHYGKASPATFNRNLAAIQSLFAWAMRRKLVREDPTVGLDRRKERRTKRQADQQRAIDYADLDAVWSRKDIALRDKTLWRMLYETGGRANEILGLDVDDLDLPDRSARITGKGGHVERVFWATGTARLLPRLLGDRTSGPMFVTDRAALRPMAKSDLDRASGRARLSYRRAAEIFTESTGGWTLHQLRHSRLTHLAEDGVDTALLKAKSRHRSLRSLERYVRPSEAAVAKLTADHDPARHTPARARKDNR